MKITINSVTYTKLRSLSFSPEIDLTGNSLPINEFSADIITTDTIAVGQFARLYDDLDHLWARYYIMKVERQDRQTVRVLARSLVALLDSIRLQAVRPTNWGLNDAIIYTFLPVDGGSIHGQDVQITYDSALQNATITGYLPEQTARERLQSILMAVGAYYVDFNMEYMAVRVIPGNEDPAQADPGTLIPIDKTFWKPRRTYRDPVSKVTVKYYELANRAAGDGERTIRYNGLTYAVTEAEMSLSNPNFEEGALPENEVVIENNMLVNPNNANSVLTAMAQYYFNRDELELDCVDNAEYWPGDLAVCYADEDSMATGVIQSAAFSFGLQARAKLKIPAATAVESAVLTVIYTCDGHEIARAAFTFPVGYGYSVQNPYLDLTGGSHRIIYRPTSATTTGTVAAGGSTVYVACAPALDMDLNAKELTVISVDSATQDQNGVVTI